MTSMIHVRPREERDLEPLADLWVATWQDAMPEIEFSARRRWFCTHLPALEQQGSKTICAVNSSDSILGFVSINPATFYLDQLAVALQCKGKGIAKILLNEARQLSPAEILLDVNCSNTRAVAFYFSQGFQIIDKSKNLSSGLKTWRLRSAG